MEPRAGPEIAGAGFRPATLTLAEGELPYLIGGGGPLVVLSYTMGPLAWGNLERLAASCTVVVLDWPAAPLDFGVAASHYWLTPLAETLGFERAALCTWSLGTSSALRYAACRPPLLSHLILAEPAGLRIDFRGGLWPDQPTSEQLQQMVAGRHFGVFGPEAGTVAATWLPHGRLVIFEESSHAVPLEEPERLQDEVATFLLANDGSEEPV